MFTRWDKGRGWIRVLPIADRRAQLDELVEIQQVANHLQASNFTYLLGRYNIVRGLDISVVSNQTPIQLHISRGLIYVDIDNLGYFVEIPSQSISIGLGDETVIGVRLRETQSKDLAEYRNPITGGPIGGAMGAGRLVIKPLITKNDPNSYPIALVRSELNRVVEILHYRHKQGRLTRFTDKLSIPQAVVPPLARRWLEETGDFIANGLELFIDGGRIKMGPGSAYIGGHRVRLPYPTYMRIEDEDDGRYYISLDDRGGVDLREAGLLPIHRDNIVTYVGSQGNPLASSRGGILISSKDGVIDRVSRSSVRGLILHHLKMEGGVLSPVPLPNRALTNRDIYRLASEIERVEQDTMDLSLERQLLEDNLGSTLNGVYTDPLTSEEGSNTNHPLYTARITSQGLTVGLDREVLSITTPREGLVRISKEDVLSFIVPSYTESVVVEQAAYSGITSTLLVPREPLIQALPNRLILEDGSPLQSTINLIGYNLQPNSSGYILMMGDTLITNYLRGADNPLNLRTREDGSISVTFTCPRRPTSGLITLRKNEAVVASTCVELKSVTEGINSYSPTNQDSPITNTLAQSFSLAAPSTISSISLKIRDIPSNLLPSSLLGRIYIVRMENGSIRYNQVVASGDMRRENTIPSTAGSAWSTYPLDYPTYLESGSYAMVIAPYYSSIGLYRYRQGESAMGGAAPNTNLGYMWLGNQRLTRDDLTMRLNGPRALNRTTAVGLDIQLGRAVHKIEYDLDTIRVGDTNVRLQALEGDRWKDIPSGYSIDGQDSPELRLVLDSTDSNLPVVSMSSATLIASTIKPKTNWISKVKYFSKPYSNVEIRLRHYSPPSTNIRVFVSGDRGSTWDECIVQPNSTLIDGNYPSYESTWRVKDLGTLIRVPNLDGTLRDEYRNNVMVRIEILAGNREPLIRDLRVISY